MNYDLLFVIIFYSILFGLFLIFRSKFEVQSRIFVLYKTKWGIRAMDIIAKRFPRLISFFGSLGIVTGFVGMAFIFWILIKGTWSLIFVPAAAPVLSPVLPGVAIAGMPILSFWHWIIAILLIAVIHEFSHGIYARKNNVTIKSSGFAFLGPLLAAFVEPDEKVIAKKSNKAQLEIFAAGPFSNILTAGIILVLILFIVNPLSSSMLEEKGLVISGIDKTMPINGTLIKEGMVIDSVDGSVVTNSKAFTAVIAAKKPGDTIFIESNKTFYEVVLGSDTVNKSKAKMGVFVSPNEVGLKQSIKEKFFDFYPIYSWTMMLIFWLFAISLGVGLFNLLPLGPVDGGRMFFVGMLVLFKNEKLAKKLYLIATWICLLLIFANLLPYLVDLFTWIMGLIF